MHEIFVHIFLLRDLVCVNGYAIQLEAIYSFWNQLL